MGTRRTKGEGSIRKRKDGRWEGRYIAGHDADGNPIRKSVLSKTQSEVLRKLRRAIELSKVIDVGRAEEFTVQTWVTTWFEVYSKPNIRESTQARYWNLIRCHIIPHLGHIKLSKLTSRDVQVMYNNLKHRGRIKPSAKLGKRLSASYIQGLHRMFHMCLQRAVKERLIPYNPSDDCILPKDEKKEIKCLKPEDAKKYLAEAERQGILPMFFLEFCTGLRRGELVALLWTDLDMANKTISITKQGIDKEDGKIEVAALKTATSMRIIPIPQKAVDLLIAEHEKHPDSPYMFPSPNTGEVYSPSYLYQLHIKILKNAGLKHIRFHDLRHTFAATALQNGVDIRTVSSMLGHADPAFTLRTYTHATKKVQ